MVGRGGRCSELTLVSNMANDGAKRDVGAQHAAPLHFTAIARCVSDACTLELRLWGWLQVGLAGLLEGGPEVGRARQDELA